MTTDIMSLEEYRAGLRKARKSEETEGQIALFDLLRRLEGRWPLLAYVTHVANESSGGSKVRRSYTKRDGTQGYKMVPVDVMRDAQMGVKKGVPDVVCFVQRYDAVLNVAYPGLVVEMKADDGDTSPHQKRWLAHLTAQGWKVVVNVGDWRPAARLIIDWCGGDSRAVEGL